MVFIAADADLEDIQFPVAQPGEVLRVMQDVGGAVEFIAVMQDGEALKFAILRRIFARVRECREQSLAGLPEDLFQHRNVKSQEPAAVLAAV
jgi:hypothetical protein